MPWVKDPSSSQIHTALDLHATPVPTCYDVTMRGSTKCLAQLAMLHASHGFAAPRALSTSSRWALSSSRLTGGAIGMQAVRWPWQGRDMSMSIDTTPTLHYFDVSGRGELTKVPIDTADIQGSYRGSPHPRRAPLTPSNPRPFLPPLASLALLPGVHLLSSLLRSAVSSSISPSTPLWPTAPRPPTRRRRA